MSRQPSTASLLALAALFCGPILAAQTATPTTATPTPTVTVYSREIALDVNVTDASGKFVSGLTPSDFTVLEDGKPVTPRVREHRVSDDQPAAPKAALPTGTFTNTAPPEGPRPLNILLLDEMNIPLATQSILQKQVADLVKSIPPGTRLAVFALTPTGRLFLLQGFTADQELLKNAIKSRELSMQVPPFEDFGQDSNTDTPPPPPASFQTNNKKQQPVANPPNQQPRVDLNIECTHTLERGQYTFDAISQIARYVSGMPGRKNLIWYTGLFPQSMRDKQGGVCFDFRENMRAIGERLGHSRVVLYPIDPRALDITARANPDSRIVRLQETEHLKMEAMAEDSGGKAFYNTNDLAAVARQAIDAGSNYYSVTYTPNNQNWDTRLRNVSVTVDKPGLNLVYRHSYHAVLAGDTVSGQTIVKATPIQTAMMRGAPEPSEIPFHLHVAPAAAPESSPAPGNNPDPKAMKPPYRRLDLSYSVDINAIQFDLAPDNTYHGQFEYTVNVYDPHDGKLLNSDAMASHPVLPADAYQSMLANGANLHQAIDVPGRGDYILRIGIHDITSDRIGAIEIPSSSITP